MKYDSSKIQQSLHSKMPHAQLIKKINIQFNYKI
ncbi:MAG: hypothetical protein Edafosvirus15_4 [Edafosvirus sp.]|uniref:Uncharacterized protein n=1 Tax=Edafosvirus sp. TaxID=2487765 RepID=A0A3G4ZY34_9VIRU|nr:MAG: hypothetical protein Edafosvirus15_4 [Edafosvirus sp.]